MALVSTLALHAAALSGHVSTVKLLLDNDAQVDATDVMKHTPLFRACEMGHRDVIQTLIKGELTQGLLLGLTGKIGTPHTGLNASIHSESHVRKFRKSAQKNTVFTCNRLAYR